jgi:hypothetical protein
VAAIELIFPVRVKKWISSKLRMLTHKFPVKLVLSIISLLLLDAEDKAVPFFVKTDNPFLIVELKDPEEVGKCANRIVTRIVACNRRPDWACLR